MNRQIVRYAGIPVGVLLPMASSMRFMAVKFQVIGLDGRQFDSLLDAESVVCDHIRRSSRH